jgi:hypothetical protein
LLSDSISPVPKVRMGVQESFVELVQEKVENPLEFSNSLKAALENRSANSLKVMVSHLYVKYMLLSLSIMLSLKLFAQETLFPSHCLDHFFQSRFLLLVFLIRNTNPLSLLPGLLLSTYTTETM